jgi:hypothetical protein
VSAGFRVGRLSSDRADAAAELVTFADQNSSPVWQHHARYGIELTRAVRTPAHGEAERARVDRPLALPPTPNDLRWPWLTFEILRSGGDGCFESSPLEIAVDNSDTGPPRQTP